MVRGRVEHHQDKQRGIKADNKTRRTSSQSADPQAQTSDERPDRFEVLVQHADAPADRSIRAVRMCR